VVWLPACNTPFLRLIKCVVPGLVAAGIYPPKAKVTRSNRDGCATHCLTPEYAGGNLRQQTCESGDSQHEADISRCPPKIRQIDCNKWPEPRQQSSKEEVQPIQRIQTFRNRVAGLGME
jgi:hypothetical protein